MLSAIVAGPQSIMALPLDSWTDGPLRHDHSSSLQLCGYTYNSHLMPGCTSLNPVFGKEADMEETPPQQHTRPFSRQDSLPMSTTKDVYKPPFRPDYYARDTMELANVIENSVSGVLDSSQLPGLQLVQEDSPQLADRSFDSMSSSAESPEPKYSDQLAAMQHCDSDTTMGEAPSPGDAPDSTSEYDMSDGRPKGAAEASSRAKRSGHQLLSDKRSHVLPPCKVCGTQATGFHYGVNTCEACKGFFRRCLLKKKDTMRCVKGSKCHIQPGKRNLCVLCRYQKCLQAGMSVEGIKTGRYTYKKRTQDIIELQKLRQEECALVQQTSVRLRHSAAMETIMTVIRSQEKNLEESLQNMQMLYKSPPTEHPIIQGQYGGQKALLLADSGPKKQKLLGLYKSMEKGLVAVVRFAKDIPLFKVLPLVDQMNIFKSSTFEVWLIARHRAFEFETGKFTTINGYTITLRELLDPTFYEVIMRSVRCLQKLQLTIEETVILKALAYFFTDRCELQRPDLVEEGQEKMMNALELLLTKNHPQDRCILAKVLGALAMLREASEMFYGNKKCLLEFLDSDSVPLIQEVLNTN